MSAPSDRDRTKPPWRPPTRRAFVAMLGAAAAVLAAGRARALPETRDAEPQERGPTRWIGHC